MHLTTIVEHDIKNKYANSYQKKKERKKANMQRKKLTSDINVFTSMLRRENFTIQYYLVPAFK